MLLLRALQFCSRKQPRTLRKRCCTRQRHHLQLPRALEKQALLIASACLISNVTRACTPRCLLFTLQFYYMANAMGRLVGVLLGGVIYQYSFDDYGLSMVLWVATPFLLLAGVAGFFLNGARFGTFTPYYVFAAPSRTSNVS